MLDIQQQICSIKKVELIFAYFLPEDAVLMELIANIIIEYLLFSNAVLSINLKIFLVGLDSQLLDKT